MGGWRRWKPGDCLICALHRPPHLTFPAPMRVFWHQHGQAPLCLDWPDPADVSEDERERWEDAPFDEWHDVEPGELTHYNRHQRKRKHPTPR